MSRKEDLEQLIRDSYDIIHQYEEIVQTSERPEEKARAQREIKEQRELATGYLAEYQALCQRLGRPLAGDILEIVDAAPGPGPGCAREREMVSLRTQLEEARANLLLIRERKSQYVMETSIPLDLVKQERQWERRIADLEARLA